MKPTGPLFKWFGSKWQASKYYPIPLGGYLFEPYAGSASYSLRNYDKNLKVCIAESNPLLYQLWRWLINEATTKLILDIPIDIEPGTNIKKLGLTQGQSLLLKHWQRTNNVGHCWTTSPWGNSPGQWTKNTRERVSEEIKFVKDWTLLHSAQNIWNFISAYDSTFFVDPPYMYNYKYQCSDIDYQWLAKEILRRECRRMIVCEAVHPKTGIQPDWLPFEPFRSTVTSRRKATQSHHSKELIYTKTMPSYPQLPNSY